MYSLGKGGGAEGTFLFGKIINCETIHQHDVTIVSYTGVSCIPVTDSSVRCYCIQYVNSWPCYCNVGMTNARK